MKRRETTREQAKQAMIRRRRRQKVAALAGAPTPRRGGLGDDVARVLGRLRHRLLTEDRIADERRRYIAANGRERGRIRAQWERAA